MEEQLQALVDLAEETLTLTQQMLALQETKVDTLLLKVMLVETLGMAEVAEGALLQLEVMELLALEELTAETVE